MTCGETFTLFATKQQELIVTGLLEATEEQFAANRKNYTTPHIVPFDAECILQIAAGARFALVSGVYDDFFVIIHRS